MTDASHMSICTLAGPEDYDAFIDMAHEIHAERPGHRDRAFASDRVDQLWMRAQGDASGAEACVLIAKNDGVAIGMMVCFAATHYFGESRFVIDLDTYIRPEWRKSDALDVLIRKFEQWAKGHTTTEWCLSASANAATGLSVEAYRRLGYELQGYRMVKHVS